jgi:hypothetical protein
MWGPRRGALSAAVVVEAAATLLEPRPAGAVARDAGCAPGAAAPRENRRWGSCAAPQGAVAVDVAAAVSVLAPLGPAAPRDSRSWG